MKARLFAFVVLAAAPLMLGAAAAPTSDISIRPMDGTDGQPRLTPRQVTVVARRVGEDVVVVARGEHGTTGYRNRLDVIDPDGPGAILRLVTIGPPPGSFVGQAITPFVARARISDPAGEIVRVRVRINGQVKVVQVR